MAARARPSDSEHNPAVYERRTIATKLKQAGVPMRGHSLSHEEADRLVKLYESGLSLVAAGDQVGYPSRTVLRVLIERGVPRRDGHGRVRPVKDAV